MLLRSLVGFLSLTLSFVVATAGDPFTAVTYNIRYASPRDGEDIWTNRVEAVADFIRTKDVVGLQEVTHPQLVDLQKRLADFDSYGVGRDDGKKGGEYSPVFFRRDRFEATDRGTFWLSDRPEKVGSKGWDAALPRVCSWVVLRDRKSDERFWIASTHFDHRGAKARHESGKLIAKMAEKRKDLPIIVLGDFNCLADSPPYQSLVAEGTGFQLFDARKRSASKPTGPDSTWCGFRQITPGRIIDHVFVNDRVAVDSLDTQNPKTSAGRFASDHLPVVVTVRVSTDRLP